MIQSFRIWEDFAALLNLMQLTKYANLPEKIGKSTEKLEKCWQ